MYKDQLYYVPSAFRPMNESFYREKNRRQSAMRLDDFVKRCNLRENLEFVCRAEHFGYHAPAEMLPQHFWRSFLSNNQVATTLHSSNFHKITNIYSENKYITLSRQIA